ncbi:conjugal transfer protein, partial [Klebsiella oxytoca]
MQSPSAQIASQNNRSLIFISVVMAVVLLWLFFDYLVYASCLLLYHLWLIPWRIAPSLLTEAPVHINLLARTGNESRMVSLSEWLEVMEHSAGIIFWYVLPFIITGLVLGVRHPAMSHHSRRVIDIHNLARLMVAYSPVIAPVLCYGDKKELLLNDTTPAQAPALSPEAFVRQHHLIRH